MAFPKFDFITNLDRLTQQATDFIRGNPIVSTAAVGIGTTGVAVAATRIIRRKKKKKVKKKTRRKAKRKKKRKAPRRRKARRKRRIIRGRGLGRSEIKHSGKGTKGSKRVSFVTKDGKRVSFKVKGTSKRRRGFSRR